MKFSRFGISWRNYSS